MFRRLCWTIGALCVALLLSAHPVAADNHPQDKGLLITPLRQYLSVDPGKSAKSSLTVANLTENPIDITLSVQQFSVADYSYDYKFEMPKENWITLETTRTTLKKTESRVVSYNVSAPDDATPGGHYFTIFASMSLGEGKQVRAATVLYVTVTGDLVKSNTIVQESLPLVSIGGDVSFRLDIRNTGNTHFPIYASGVLGGILSGPSSNEAAHLLLPGTTRTVEGKIPTPHLPGIYQATYGYRDEDGHDTRRSRYILYAPPWSWALVIGLVWFGIVFFKRRRRVIRETKSPTDS